MGGLIPASKAAVYTMTDALATGITVDVIQKQVTVLHIGTTDGRVKKVSEGSRFGVPFGIMFRGDVSVWTFLTIKTINVLC